MENDNERSELSVTDMAQSNVLGSLFNKSRKLAKITWGLRHIGLGVGNAGFSILEGLGLSFGALAINFGKSDPVAGFVECVYHLEETVAAALGDIVDGILSFRHEAGNIIAEQGVPVKDSAATVIPHVNTDIDSHYYHKEAIRAVKGFNKHFLDGSGKSLINSYENVMSHWYGDAASENTAPNSRKKKTKTR